MPRSVKISLRRNDYLLSPALDSTGIFCYKLNMKKVAWLLILLALLAPAVYSRQTGAGSGEQNKDGWETQLRKFSRIYAAIKSRYPREIDVERVFFASISGLLRSLDPHSYFMDPVAVRSLNEDQQGNYYGIGTRITKYEDRLTIIAPIKGTPAYEQGIIAGDVIVTIDGTDTKDLSIDEAMQKLRGAKDSIVEIEIMRQGLEKPILFKIKRAEIPLDSISYSMLHPLDRRIGYISIRTFGNTTPEEFGKMMEKLKQDHNIEAVIIDLRGNPGGSLYAAVDIADYFLPKGKVIVAIKGRNLRQNFVAQKDGQYEGMPVAVLINRGTASASEIVASALQDHKKAAIFGSRSWGKGLVQTVHKLALSSSVALTTAKYYTPLDKSLQREYSKLDDYIAVLNDQDYDQDTSIEGGVIPDFYIRDSFYHPLLVRLISAGVFFKFSQEWLEQNKDIDESFKADDPVIEAFKAFLKKERFAFTNENFKSQRPTIREEIERSIKNSKFSPEKGYEVFLASDPVSRKAVEILMSQSFQLNLPRDGQNIEGQNIENKNIGAAKPLKIEKQKKEKQKKKGDTDGKKRQES